MRAKYYSKGVKNFRRKNLAQEFSKWEIKFLTLVKKTIFEKLLYLKIEIGTQEVCLENTYFSFVTNKYVP